MTRSTLTGSMIAAVIGMATSATLQTRAISNSVGAGLLGFGVGAIVGSALTPREVYVVPPAPPPPPPYYGPVGYGPQPWSPGLVQILS